MSEAETLAGPERRSAALGQPLLGSYRGAAEPAQILQSRCGRYRIEHFEGTWQHPAGWNEGARGRWSRLLNAATGEMLLDSARVFDSDWALAPDGGLLFRFRLGNFGRIEMNREELFRIDPSDGSFRNLAIGRTHPLAALQQDVVLAHSEALWSDVPGRPPLEELNALGRIYSPFGSFRCEILYWDVAHGWGLIPRLFLTERNEPILDLGEWGAEAGFAIQSEEAVRIALPGSPRTILDICPAGRVGRIDGGEARLPLAEIERQFFRG